ncbi:MAG: YceI family protein [Chloroflexi bacterium]|nr:YceI family protein [Chloroflexota bacterium]
MLVFIFTSCSTPETIAPAPTNTAAQAQPPAPKGTFPPQPPSGKVQPGSTATQSPLSLSNDALPKDAIRIVIVPEKSEARYRVREQLAGVNFPSDAIGATRVITGTIIGRPDGTIISAASKFRVDLRTLKSDRDQRDNFLRMDTLQTNRYPFAEFVPMEAPGLPLAVPADGKADYKLIGDLTIRDVTKRVTWDVSAKTQGNEATGQAKTSFNFATFNMQIPRVFTVLSIDDKITLELDFVLQRVQ